MRRLVAPAAALLALAATAPGALAYGPRVQPGDRAFEACGNVIDRQTGNGVQAGGGPKSVDVGPTNCDHFWQSPNRENPIGNGWPPPPFQP